MLRAVTSLRSVCYKWRKTCKTLYDKVRYVPNVLFSEILSVFFDLYAQVLAFYVFQWPFLSEFSGFNYFSMKWLYGPRLKHVCGFQPFC